MKRRNLTVMIIDNNADLKIEDGLQRSGYLTITRHSLGQAIEDVTDFTNRNRPDLILLDLDQLPAEELWMIRTLHETAQCPDLPILYLGAAKQAAAFRMTGTPPSENWHGKGEMKQLTALIDDLLSQKPLATARGAN